jgi:putative ABC transport system permease protein
VNLWESILVSLGSLRDNKFRSFLTVIGIVVGVAAVVTVISIGQAGKSSLVSEIDMYGDGFFVVVSNPSQGFIPKEQLDPTLSDLEALSRIPGLIGVSGETTVMMDSKIGKQELSFVLNATTAERTIVENIELIAGRFFNESEQRSRQKVIVVESRYAELNFGSSEQVIGRKVYLNGSMYRIIGVYKTDESLFAFPKINQYSAYVPFHTISLNSGGSDRLNTLYLKADAADPKQMNKIINQVKTILAKRHNTTSGSYYSQTGEEAQTLVKSVFGILQIIIGSIAGISLLVGGIGVMNIMLVSVTERTKEIGIRKAIGATPGAILWQFIIEAMVLCLAGGLVGTLMGLAGAFIVSLLTKWPFIVSWWAILLAVGFSGGIGIFFGIYPASKAARMQPIESLRYE